LGETKINETKTPKGEKITINHDKGKTITSEKNSLALYAMSMDIIQTTTPKFFTSNV
jgi:hypothetical protein